MKERETKGICTTNLLIKQKTLYVRRQFHYSRTLKKIPNCCVSRPGHFVGSRFNHNFLFAFPSTLNSLSQQRKIDTHIRLLYRNDEVVYISYIYSIYSPVNWLIIKQKKKLMELLAMLMMKTSLPYSKCIHQKLCVG